MVFKKRKILVTSALPYANGPLHLGHMLEHIQTDIWVRTQKLAGNLCISVCGDDAHGSAIMLKAEELKITPEQLIAKIQQQHETDFEAFGIYYDSYNSSHSPENNQLVIEIYNKLLNSNNIFTKSIDQAFDPVKNMFLPDRFLKGTCPKCGAADQYGDNCEMCGETYAALDLIEPKSVLSGAKPVRKRSEHYFFDLPKHHDFLQDWIQAGALQVEVLNKLKEWFIQGLKPWDISRDEPYFGFKIPNTIDKYFYVWLDAPIDYMASFKKYAYDHALDFEEFWKKDSDVELYHFIGKDIIYFHALFWPALLRSCNYRLPSGIFAHGYLNINGQKMSKSRGTFILASSYLRHLHPDFLRYYLASKLTAKIDDIDLNFEDFFYKVNADLIGKVINIASRCAAFINKYFQNQLADNVDLSSIENLSSQRPEIVELYLKRDYAQALKLIIAMAATVNQYIDQEKPWILIKDPNKYDKVHRVCTYGLNAFRLIMGLLKPVLPFTASKVAAFLNCDELDFDNVTVPLLNHKINTYSPLLTRVTMDNINAISNENKTDTLQVPAKKALISIEDFNKIDLKVAKITSAEVVEGADKLLKLQLEVDNEVKQVFAGIKSFYQPENLVGKLVIIVNNLEPRTMRFGKSEAMVLAASDGKQLFLITPDGAAATGMQVK